MRILVISSTIFPVPLHNYGGLEQIAWQVAEGLHDKGHDVTLVAPRGSETKCELHPTTVKESEELAFSGYREKLKDFDVIIDHSWQKFAYLAGVKAPVLGVLHAPVNTMYRTPPPVEKPCLVAISKDQAKHVKEHLNRDAEVCYNGVNPDFYKPMTLPRTKRYLFLARFSAIKGPHLAVEAAIKCGVGLDLIGDDTITGEPELIKAIQRACALNPGLRYVGLQHRARCVEWFNTNYALLHPVESFREPFGLAPVESQLCGCPVIGWDNGALRETVLNGETGFLVKSLEEIIELIKTDAIKSINRIRCREWASQFNEFNMINRYEALCEQAIETGGW